MRSIVLLAALTAATPSLAQEKTAEEDWTIVVTGTPLADSAKRLKECLARHCPPLEDMAASIAHAENQFLAGDYLGSRKTLADSRDRNKRYAKQYPLQVSDLERGYGRLTNMYGLPDSGRLHQIEAVETLKGALDAKDSRVLAQELMAGDDYLALGRVDAAIDVYRKVEKKARDAHQLNMVGFAMLRQAALYATISEDRESYRGLARSGIRRIENTREPELEQFRIAARVLDARLAGFSGDKDGMDAKIRDIAGKGVRVPVLVFSEPFREDKRPVEASALGTSHRGTDTNPEWIDVRYRISADGRVHDIEQLRASPRIEGNWPEKVRASIATRRYVPLDLPAGSDGMERIERFTYVFDITRGDTGTRTGFRSTNGRLTTLDITPPEPQAGARGG